MTVTEAVSARSAGRLLAALRIVAGIVSFTVASGWFAPASAQAPEYSVVNRATVVFMDDEGTPGAAEASATITVRPRAVSPAELSLTKSVDRSTAVVGDTISYTIRWQADADLPGALVIRDVLSPSLSFITGSVTSSVAVTTSVSGQVLEFVAATVAAGSGQVQFQAVVTAPGELQNVASGEFIDGTDIRIVTTDTTGTTVTDPPPQQAALRLQKSVDRTQAETGDTLRYTLSWTNTGAGIATGMVLTDTLPAQTSFITGSVQSALAVDVTASDGVLQIALPDIMPGASGTLTFDVHALSPGLATNYARIGFVSADVPATAVSDTAATVIAPRPERASITLFKTVDRQSATVGDTVLYTLRWENRGAGAATSVVIADTLPSMTAFVDGSVTSAVAVQVAADGRVVELRVPDIMPGGTGELSFAAVATAPGEAANHARAAFMTAEAREFVGSDTAVTMIAAPPSPSADLQLAKSVDRDVAAEGDTITWTIRWLNRGAGVAAGVVLHDTVSGLVALVEESVTSAGAHVAGEVVQLAVGDVAPGDSGMVRLSAVVHARAGTVENVAHASYTSADVARSVQSDTARTRLETPEMELELVALVDGPLYVGDTLTYRIRVRNPSATVQLHNVVLTDSLPDELRYLGADPVPSSIAAAGVSTAPAPYPAAGGVIGWNFPLIEPLGTIEILLHTEVLSIGNGRIVNSVAARGAGILQALTAVAAATVQEERAGLEIERSATALEVASGDAVGYTIAVRNTGVVALDDVVITELMDARVEPHTGSVSGAALSRDGNVLRFTVGSLAPGASAVVQYAATVIGPRGAQVRNRAWAVGTAGQVEAARTDTVELTVRLRGGAMDARIVMGRIWLDANGDGRQQAEEKPLSSAVIWSSHGETVRADSLGRFTFPDLDAGRYTMRVDPASVPPGWTGTAPRSVRVDGASTPVLNFALPRGDEIVTEDNSMSAAFLLEGGATVPRPRITAPHDGAVIGTNRLFVRGEGEPQVPVKLYLGDDLIAEDTSMPDGSVEFLSVELKPGLNVLDAVFDGSGGEQRVTVRVHASGPPHVVELADTGSFRAGTHHVVTLRVLDEWSMPVAQEPLATVAVAGLRLLDGDVDEFSVGTQLPVSEDGRLLLRVQADSAGAGTVSVAFGGTPTTFTLSILPELRSLVLLADGEIGIGAATPSYGSAVARGAIGAETSVTLSYDSRRTREDAFAGVYDPFDEGRYATLGDRSTRTVLGSNTTPLSLKVERDAGWLLLGDIDTRGFGNDNSPGAYRRALPGLSGAWNEFGVSVTGFGSMVAQQLVQKQIRGNGTSGPYHLGGAVRLGTERLAVETRDRLNASLVLSRQELERYVDYDIDATTGAILLRRPLASTDAAGNPIMLMTLAERVDGTTSFVGGVQAHVGLAPFGTMSDSVRIGGGYVEDRSPLGGHRIISADAGASATWGAARLEAARAEAGDSAGFAVRATAWVGSENGTKAALEWSRVGDGFGNPANPRLVAGTEDLRLSGSTTRGAWSGTASYARQWFRARGAERTQGGVTIGHSANERKLSLDVGVLGESIDADSASIDFTSLTSRLSLAESGRTAWLEAVQPVSGDGAAARPATYGIGATYDIGHGVVAEASQRIIRTDSTAYGVTAVGLRSELSTGTRLWSEYQQHSGADAAHSSTALIGLAQKLRIADDWAVDGQYERRAGLSELPATDPARALPFPQQEQDRWAAALGVSWAPARTSARASLRGELSDDAITGRSYRILGTGEAALNRSLTLFLRQDTRAGQQVLTTGTVNTSTLHSIVAAAFRPAARSDWNALAKLEWRSDENPRRDGGAVLQGTDRRIIAAAEAVWTPRPTTELGLRYAMRRGERGGALAGGAGVSSNAHYAGIRMRSELNRWLDLRGAARLLAEEQSGLIRFDVAPAFGILLIRGLELEVGYRFGDLADTDFARSGGNGFYTSLGMSITEESGRTIAEFWRRRMEDAR